MLSSPTRTDALPAPAQDPYRAAWNVVLERTSRGDAEAQQPQLRLSSPQRQLLAAIDGRRSLHAVVARQPELATARLSREAARLLAFGLVRQIQGELPRALVVAAMNLTLQMPAGTAAAWTRAQAPIQPAPVTIEEELPPERWPDIEPDEWLDDEPALNSAADRAPGMLQALPYMAMASAATLLLAWLAWQ
jgi:predicted transcriptional regulator